MTLNLDGRVGVGKIPVEEEKEGTLQIIGNVLVA